MNATVNCYPSMTIKAINSNHHQLTRRGKCAHKFNKWAHKSLCYTSHSHLSANKSPRDNPAIIRASLSIVVPPRITLNRRMCSFHTIQSEQRWRWSREPVRWETETANVRAQTLNSQLTVKTRLNWRNGFGELSSKHVPRPVWRASCKSD